MSQSLQTPVVDRDQTECSPTRKRAAEGGAPKSERRLDAFVAELRQMTREKRIRASRYSFRALGALDLRGALPRRGAARQQRV